MTLTAFILAAVFCAMYLIASRHKFVVMRHNAFLVKISDAMALEVTQLKQQLEGKDAKIRALEAGLRIERKRAEAR
jgi:hypothetical protein